MNRITSFLRANFSSFLSGSLAVYFFLVFHLHVGFPPAEPLTTAAAIYLALSVFFWILPLAHRLRVGKLIDFESKVQEVRTEMKDTRAETRELVSTVSAVASALSATVSQSVVVNLPNPEEERRAREALDESLTQSQAAIDEHQGIREYQYVADFDANYALARLRMDLETQLRRILGKRLTVVDPFGRRGKFLSAGSLFRELVDAFPRYSDMERSFDYVLKVCNAAIHGQRVPDHIAHAAIDMGSRMLRVLTNELGRDQDD